MKMRKRAIRWQDMDKKSTPFNRLIDDFLLTKRSAGCSEKTLEAVRNSGRIML